VNRAGNSTEPPARVTTTRPSSSGWRSASTASRRNSVSSSRNRTPRWARLASPGRSTVEPPPSRPAVEIEWCGARKGRRRRSPRPASRPATECSCVASRASSRVRSGRIVGSLRASIVLPAPGEPTSRTLCPPAAATSSARRACVCPRTSARSTSAVRSSGSSARTGGGCQRPRRNPTTSPSEATPTTRSPSTWAASAAFATGTTTPASPWRAAAIATEIAPGVGSTSPFSDSSPKKTSPATARSGTWAVARSTLAAIGRSSPAPSFRRLPGARFTTTRRSGHSSPACSTAGRIRSRASWTAAPGSPVTVSEGSPRPTKASTVIG
jgi:hypothetical protein